MTTTTVTHRPTAIATGADLGALLRPVLTALRFTGHFLVALLGVIFLGSAAEH
ncbi:hypothetical protein [Nocardia sp. NRRL S-836]|uniref:hypothetical protein n=1 Tax=Nocardia sp. NRRL S-836 TaxID=1519492 RepID=UPI000AE3516D|nr:hypothetical protein [Nocardia sp. NRRL S-836]